MSIGDLDGDGAPDLAVANQGDDVSVLLGAGDGTFAPQQRFAAGTSRRPCRSGTSTATAPRTSPSPTGQATTSRCCWAWATGPSPPSSASPRGTRRGPCRSGTSTATAPRTSPSPTRSDDVSVLLGAGDGTFAPEQRFAAGDAPRSVSIGDLDGDGAPDLAVANAFSDDVSVLLGAGDGTFAAEQRFGAGDSPRSVSIGDLDGDGAPDLAVANTGFSRRGATSRCCWARATGPSPPSSASPRGTSRGPCRSGTSTATAPRTSPSPTEATTSRCCWAWRRDLRRRAALRRGGRAGVRVDRDLDGDGAPDLAVANAGSDDVSVLLNQRGAARSGLLAGREPGERLERFARVRPGPVRPARAGVATLTLRDLADAAAVGPRNLNARGQRAGSLTLDGAERPAIIDAGGRVTPIEIPAATAGQALAINDAGQAAGWYETESGEVRAFRADPGEPALDLGALGGGLTVALAINEAGDVAGYALDAEGREHAFLFSDGGGLRRLGNLGGGMARGLGVSDRDDGMVVGAAENALGDLLAFAWTEPSGVVDLNTVLPEDAELTLTVAEGFDGEGGVIARADDGLTERAVRLELEVLPPRTPGDLDGDGAVGAADLRRMIAAFGTPEASADLDGDGVVTAADVSTLVANWGAARE